MGMRGLGQIDVLTKIAEPNYAGITNIGSAHIEILGSRENIRQAKLEIINGFNEKNDSNRLYLNKELSDFVTSTSPYAELLRDKKIELNTFDLYHYESSPMFLISEGLLEDMDLVRLIALDMGMSEIDIKNALDSYVPDNGRGNFIFKESIVGKKNILFIDETYNSNIEAVRNSVNAIKQIFPDDKKIIVLGAIKENDALEVEKLFHLYNRDKSIELVDARHFEHFETKMIIENLLEDNTVVFFKASRSEKLEELIALFD
jgi:UDP-N-acetylmuramoyl-tripeptide--D-alanyl-D-alanine ligase